MSLIPSESFSFPDDFSRSISRARTLEERQRLAGKTQPAAPAKPKEEPAARIEPPPRVEATSVKVPAAKENVPAAKPVPRKVPFRNVSASKVAAQSNARPPGAKRFGPVRLTKAVRVSPKVVVDLAKKAPPAAEIAAPNEEQLMLTPPNAPRRRNRKMPRF